MDKLYKITNIYNEVIAYKQWKNPENAIKDALPLLRKRFHQILKNVLYRDYSTYKRNKNGQMQYYVPSMDAPVIRELLIRSTRGKGHDPAYSQWLNGSLNYDFHKIANLYRSLLSYLDSLEENHVINMNRKIAWKEAFNSSLGGDTAVSLSNMVYSMNHWFDNSKLLNHYLISEQSQQEMASENPGFITMMIPEAFDINAELLPDLLKHIHRQDEYIHLLMEVFIQIEMDANEKTKQLITQIIADRQGVPIKLQAFPDLMPNGWLSFSKGAYEYLKRNPHESERIADSLHGIDPVSFFKLLENDSEKYKNDLKMNIDDTATSDERQFPNLDAFFESK